MSHALKQMTAGFALCMTAITTTPAQAAFMVTSTCATDVMIQEGNPGSIDCTVKNMTADPVYIMGEFGWVVTLAKPDKSDKVIGIIPPHLKAGGTLIGGKPFNDTTIAAGGTDVLKFLVKTDKADINELPLDYGINIVNVLLDLYSAPKPTDPGSFVPSTDTGGIVYVLDAPKIPVTPPTNPPPHFNVGTGDDYKKEKKTVGERGFVTTAPEPLTASLLVAGLAGLGWSRRGAKHRSPKV